MSASPRPAEESKEQLEAEPVHVEPHAEATPAAAHAAAPAAVDRAPPVVYGAPLHDGNPATAAAGNTLSPSFKRALQNIRAQDLQQEAALVAHASAAEDSFWLKQEERYNLMHKRAQMGAASAKDLYAYLKKTSKLLQGTSEALTALGSFGVSGETGTMRVACMSIDIVRKSTGSYLTELNARVFTESLQRANEAVEASAQLLSTLESAGNDALKQLKAQRKLAHEAWAAYVAHGQERHQLERQGKTLKTDPYLLCRAYEHEMYTMHTAEVKFSQLMASLLRDLEVADAKRMVATKATLLDNLNAQKAVLEHTVKFTENALITVRAIDPAQDIREFTTAADLYLPANTRASSGASPSAASDATEAASLRADASALRAHDRTTEAADALAKQTPQPAFLQAPPARDPHALARVYAHEIEKEGSLSRQGSVIKSNWKPCHAVVTSSGFLHLFEDKLRRAVYATYPLADSHVTTGESIHPLALQLTLSRSGGLFSSPTVLFFKAENADELVEWQMQIQKHQQPREAPASPAPLERKGSMSAQRERQGSVSSAPSSVERKASVAAAPAAAPAPAMPERKASMGGAMAVEVVE